MADEPTSLDTRRGMAAQKATELGEAAEKARYLLGILEQSTEATDPRRHRLIDLVMADFDHLLDNPPTP